MSLEKLKSAFSNLEKFNRTDLTKFDSGYDNIDRPDSSILPAKKGMDVNPLPATPKKIGQSINEFGATPQKPSVDVNQFGATPQKPSVDVNAFGATPEKKGRDVNAFGATPEKKGRDVNEFGATPQKPSVNVSIFDNSSKYSSRGEVQAKKIESGLGSGTVSIFDNSAKLKDTVENVGLTKADLSPKNNTSSIIVSPFAKFSTSMIDEETNMAIGGTELNPLPEPPSMNPIGELSTYAPTNMFELGSSDAPNINPFILSDLSLLETTLTDPSTDIRFTYGTGFPTNANTRLSISGQGFQASLNYIDGPTGAVISFDGSINKFGKLSEKLSSVGIDLPTIPFGAQINSPPPFLKYQDTVLELAGDTVRGIPGGFQYTPTNDDVESPLGIRGDNFGIPDYDNRTRGIVFQVLGGNQYESPIENDAKYGKFLEETAALQQVEQFNNQEMYIPAGILDASFTENQQIQFGQNDNYPDISYLSPVQNYQEFELSGPLANFRDSYLSAKEQVLGLASPKVTKKYMDMVKDGNIKGAASGFLEEINSTTGGAFNTLKQSDIVQEGSELIFGKKQEGVGDEPIVNQSPSIPLPSWGSKALSGVAGVAGGIAGTVGSFVTDTSAAVSNAFESISSEVVDFTSGLLGGLAPLANWGLAAIQSSVNVTTTDYGGQAQFKSGTPLRSASTITRPNLPTPLTRDITFQRGAASVAPETGDGSLLTSGDNSVPISKTYAEIGKNVGAVGASDFQPGRYAAATDEGGTFSKPLTKFYPNASMDETAGGDRITLAPIAKGKSLSSISQYKMEGGGNYVESEKNGLPFYIKDLRDNAYIILRGYFTEFSDTITPEWNSETYLGRSEAVHTYKSAAREISMTFQMFANTQSELDSMYGKVRRLQSLAYPEYEADKYLYGKIRMKPPIAQIRLGEVFGNNAGNLPGIFKSIGITWPETTVWEHKKGMRVPKLIEMNVTFVPIHKETPHKNTSFLGYVGGTGNDDISNSQIG